LLKKSKDFSLSIASIDLLDESLGNETPAKPANDEYEPNIEDMESDWFVGAKTAFESY
jgi:hypothetical protein